MRNLLAEAKRIGKHYLTNANYGFKSAVRKSERDYSAYQWEAHENLIVSGLKHGKYKGPHNMRGYKSPKGDSCQVQRNLAGPQKKKLLDMFLTRTICKNQELLTKAIRKNYQNSIKTVR